jgi:hypothetical protein
VSLLIPGHPEWGFFLNSTNVRPAAAVGITITPVEDAKGNYSEYVDGALVTSDVWAIAINFNSNARSGEIGNTLVDIGIDTTAGTSYTAIINNLSACHAAPYNVGLQGIWYYFPLFIPAGSSIAARASVDSTNLLAFRSFIQLYGKPRHPEAHRVGRRVETIGAVTATSEGTVVVAGGAAEGTYTSVGTLARDAWFFQMGICSSDTSLTANICDWDMAIGDATNKRTVCEPICRMSTVGTAEQFSFINDQNAFCEAKAGQNVYIRGQNGGTPDTDVTCIAYAVGG